MTEPLQPRMLEMNYEFPDPRASSSYFLNEHPVTPVGIEDLRGSHGLNNFSLRAPVALSHWVR